MYLLQRLEINDIVKQGIEARMILYDEYQVNKMIVVLNAILIISIHQSQIYLNKSTIRIMYILQMIKNEVNSLGDMKHPH